MEKEMKIVHLPIADIKIHESQRVLDMKRVKKFVDKFDPVLINPILVGEMDGNYYAYDGQHTLKILENVYGKDAKAPCIIVRGVDEEDLAMLFWTVNSELKVPTALEKAWSRLKSGDGRMNAIDSIVNAAGLAIAYPKSTSINLKLNAITTIEKVFKFDGRGDLLRIALTTIKECFPNEKDAYQGAHIEAIALFVRNYGHAENYNHNHLVKMIKKRKVEAWTEATNDKKRGTRASYRVYDYIQETHDLRNRNPLKPKENLK